ncbi:hypothetical protein ULG90_17200 [Halopseudomonas pachastrellae]|nr:hypothetical protein ULG90_17200 [Halopseudomonas pachastrellae]
MDINRYLKALVEKEGSDLFFSVGAPVTLKREGDLFAFGNQPLASGAVKELAWQVMSEKQIEEFEREQEMNLAVGLPNCGRFRITCTTSAAKWVWSCAISATRSLPLPNWACRSSWRNWPSRIAA